MRRWSEVVLVAMLVGLGACATAPAPKAPDESRRTLVNKTVPSELRGVPEIGR
jgi:hypothetical protein